MIDTVKGLLYVSKAIIPQMIERKSGHIINIGSTRWKRSVCEWKCIVLPKTCSWRTKEWEWILIHGIRVGAIHPGMVETEFSEVHFKGDTDKAATVYKGLQPLRAGRYCRYHSIFCGIQTLPCQYCRFDCDAYRNSFNDCEKRPV
jgi:NADP-dependent 3-hydroxy acid dehydrogenase YdfG